MAELADALDSGSSEGSFMQVQVLLSAPKMQVSTETCIFFVLKYDFNTIILISPHYVLLHIG